MKTRLRLSRFRRWPCTLLCTGLGLSIGGGCASLREDDGAAVVRGTEPEPAVPDSSTAPVLHSPRPADAPLSPTGCPEVLPIDLLTALNLVNSSNPTIALARERVREAYLRLREAQLAWLPDLRYGPAYNRHDGQIQNSRGVVFTTSKQNFFIGGGADLVWDSSAILFGPLIARRLVEAQDASSEAVTDDVQLQAVLTYLDLMRVYAALAVNADTLARAEEMLRYAESADRAGLGRTPADVNRARTEVNLRREERIDLKGQAAVISARLARLLLLQPTVDLRPVDPTVVPIALIPPGPCLDELVATAMQNRPEVVESQALIGAAKARLRQAQFAPFVPRVEALYTSGYFGGGVNDQMTDFNGRGDGTVQATWVLHNLGAGDVAEVRVRKTQLNEAGFNSVDVQSRVAEEVTAAARVAQARLESLDSAQQAVQQAVEMWQRLEKAAFGLAERQYDPLGPLLAEQALDQARVRYLNAVIEFNKSQFRLYWAMGKPPLCALPQASPLPVEVPVVPAVYVPPTEKPAVPPGAEGAKP